MIVALSSCTLFACPAIRVTAPHCTVGFAATNAGPRGRRQRITPAPHCTVGFAATNAGPRGRGDERWDAGDFELLTGNRHFRCLITSAACGSKPTLPQISGTESKAEQGLQGAIRQAEQGGSQGGPRVRLR